MERHFEWLNHNSLRKYPLRETVVDSELQDNFIVDLAISVPDSVVLPIHISRVHITPGLVSVAVRDDTRTIAVATGQIVDQEYFPIYFDSIDEVVSGAVVIGPGVSEVLSLGQNLLSFSVSQSEIEPSAIVRSSSSFVKDIAVEGEEEGLTGDVILVEGEGVKIDVDEESNSIIISARTPETFLAECNQDCRPEECNPPAIFAINNVLPDEDGLITFDGDDFVEIGGISSSLTALTPLLTPNDLCGNREGPSAGPPGIPGVPGARGPDGVLILPGDPIPSGCQEVIIDGPDPLSPQNGGFVPQEEEELFVLPNTAKFVASEDIFCGDALYISAENFVAKARADSSDTMPCIGFALSSVLAGDELLVQFAARINLLGNLSPGEDHYVSNTESGKVTDVPPSASGEVVQRVGTAINESILLIIFDNSVEIP